MFFDNRSRSLEAQNLEPIKTIEEMRDKVITETAILDTVTARIAGIPQYVQLLQMLLELRMPLLQKT